MAQLQASFTRRIASLTCVSSCSAEFIAAGPLKVFNAHISDLLFVQLDLSALGAPVILFEV